jgi:hypothetical protein
LQEITLINEVKKSSSDGAVNWTKFQQMSRSSAIVLDCSRLTPQLPIDKPIEALIMTDVLDTDVSSLFYPRASFRLLMTRQIIYDRLNTLCHTHISLERPSLMAAEQRSERSWSALLILFLPSNLFVVSFLSISCLNRCSDRSA